MSQLVKRSLPTTKVRGSNPVIGKFYLEHLFTDCQLFWKDENKEKEAGIGPFLKNNRFTWLVENSQTGGQLYCDTSPYKVIEHSLVLVKKSNEPLVIYLLLDIFAVVNLDRNIVNDIFALKLPIIKIRQFWSFLWI